MTKAQLNAAVENGALVVVGQYWGGRVEDKEIRNPQDKNGPRVKSFMKHETVLTKQEPIVISAFPKEGETKESWKPSAKQLEPVVVTFKITRDKYGNVSYTPDAVHPLV